mmetsp:Transcript_679/g.1875  ORF Transcript_679/g.1875 Transcript_679/m.1875 type:complete len:101 (-) Transcript_679:49-351(-)
MAVRRSSRALCGLVLLGALAAAWLAAPCFVQPPAGASRGEARSQTSSGQMPTVLGLTAASWLAASQPAFAESPQYPGWPFFLVFIVLFGVVFVLPNTIWK